MKKRIDYIDIAKGLGMIFVQIGHTAFPEMIKIWVYSFHMPLFFFLSGYIYSSEKYTLREFVLKKLKTLILPYYLFCSLSIVFNRSIAFVVGDEIDKTDFIDGILLNWHNRPMWFLMCLFITEIIYYILEKYYIKNNAFKNIIIVVICAIIALVNNKFFSMILPLDLDIFFSAIIFFALGKLLKERIEKLINGKWYLSITLLFINGCFCIGNYNITKDHIEMVISRYGVYTLFLISSLAGIFFVLNISRLIEKYRFIKEILLFIGKKSIIFYGLHTISNRVIDKLLSIILPFYYIETYKILVVLLLLFLSFSVISVVIISCNTTIVKIKKVGLLRRKLEG